MKVGSKPEHVQNEPGKVEPGRAPDSHSQPEFGPEDKFSRLPKDVRLLINENLDASSVKAMAQVSKQNRRDAIETWRQRALELGIKLPQAATVESYQQEVANAVAKKVIANPQGHGIPAEKLYLGGAHLGELHSIKAWWNSGLGGPKWLDLQKANLGSADFNHATLEQVGAQGADLRSADFRGARLDDVRLAGADLSGADFRGAYLKANLGFDPKIRGAHFEGANLRRVNAGISGTHETPTRYLTREMLDHFGATYDDKTEFAGDPLKTWKDWRQFWFVDGPF
jgi:uncharacterized protein YjbI with pentapeptide repeats